MQPNTAKSRILPFRRDYFPGLLASFLTLSLGLDFPWNEQHSSPPRNPSVSNLRLTHISAHLPPAVEKVERLNTAATGIVDILGQGTF